MKLLYITNGVHGSGGLERVLAVKASYLAEHLNYEVTILILNSDGEELFYKFSDKIKFYNINASGNVLSCFLSYRKGIKNAIKSVKPVIISVCDDGVKGLLFPVLFGKKIPVVYERHVSKQIEARTEHSSLFAKLKTILIFKLMELGGSQFDTFVVLTNGNLKEWSLTNLMLIPNPLPFNSMEKSLLNTKKVLAVGKQGYQKSYDRLLQIWKIVGEKFPDWILEVYGKREPQLGLEKRVSEFGLKSKVYFFDPVKNIQEKYKDAAIYVMSSRYEGFGMVLIEAMSFGVPCVSFDCPHGPADIINDSENGYLVENGNIEDFANRLKQLMENENLRNQMGASAKENMKCYAPDVIVPLWDDLFKKLTRPE